jgi:hypothetical protein
MFASTSESESAMITPPIKKAKTNAKNGSNAAFLNDSSRLNII